jgi:hypothetical protein
MGFETVHLPLRLDTIIFRLQSGVIPILLLLVIWILDIPKRRWWWFLALGLLLFHSLAVSVIAASRAGLINFSLPVFFLWLTARRLTRKRVLIMSLPVLGTFLVFPLVSAFRAARIMKTDNFVGAMTVAMQYLDAADWGESMRATAMHLIIRVIGAEGVWFIQRYAVESLTLGVPSWSIFQEPLAEYYTYQVLGFTILGDFRSPGLVGAFMLLGGFPGVIILWMVFIFLVYYMWEKMSLLKSAPVALATFACFLFSFVGEGTLQVQDWVSCVGAIYVCEWIYRRALLRLPSRLSMSIRNELPL